MWRTNLKVLVLACLVVGFYTTVAYIVAGFDPIMPDMRKQLSDDQIWAAVAFLESQGGEVDVTGDDIQKTAPAKSAGAAPSGPVMTATVDPVALYSEKGCIGCHQL